MNIPGKIRLVNAALRFGKPEWETLIRRTKDPRLAVDREPCPLRVPPLGLSGCVVKLIGE